MRRASSFLSAIVLAFAIIAVGAPSVEAKRFAALSVARYRAAVLVPANTSAKPLPVVVALHGNFDRPDWACEAWHAVIAQRAWLLCPRGAPRRDAPKEMDRWTYHSSRAVEKEIRAGIAALVKRYPRRVAPTKILLVGFSLGANFAAALSQAQPKRYSRVVAVEGGGRWPAPAVARFAARGGRAVILGCGGGRCARRAKRACRSLSSAKLNCQAFYAPVGHSYGSRLMRRMKKAIGEQLVALSAP